MERLQEMEGIGRSSAGRTFRELCVRLCGNEARSSGTADCESPLKYSTVGDFCNAAACLGSRSSPASARNRKRLAYFGEGVDIGTVIAYKHGDPSSGQSERRRKTMASKKATKNLKKAKSLKKVKNLATMVEYIIST
jgi:hypothetical protein